MAAMVSKYQPPSRATVPPIKLFTVGSRAFPVAAAQVWNGLPEAVIIVDFPPSSSYKHLGGSGLSRWNPWATAPLHYFIC